MKGLCIRRRGRRSLDRHRVDFVRLDSIRHDDVCLKDVDVDPRFLVTVHVESIVSGGPPWTGSNPAFAIHSPSRMFMTADAPRGRYELRIEQVGDRWTMRAVEARR